MEACPAVPQESRIQASSWCTSAGFVPFYTPLINRGPGRPVNARELPRGN